VNFNNILRLSVCPSGLRIGVFFPFAAFSREFLVPWSEIRITRGGGWFKQARLNFGDPRVGWLTIGARAADTLAAAAEGRWPEKLTPPARREPTVS
jgi:hypothetical protein